MACYQDDTGDLAGRRGTSRLRLLPSEAANCGKSERRLSCRRPPVNTRAGIPSSESLPTPNSEEAQFCEPAGSKGRRRAEDKATNAEDRAQSTVHNAKATPGNQPEVLQGRRRPTCPAGRVAETGTGRSGSRWPSESGGKKKHHAAQTVQAAPRRLARRAG
jgi:hypothetical protein